jgi:hypothetical protein
VSVVNAATRAILEERARHRCEYCHLPIRGQVATFPIDHIHPRTLAGATDLTNLALACPHCNARKWIHTQGIDSETNQTAELFNPRLQVWEEHLPWSTNNSGLVHGRTACGRATIQRLQMNDPIAVDIRQLLAALGMFPNT